MRTILIEKTSPTFDNIHHQELELFLSTGTIMLTWREHQSYAKVEERIRRSGKSSVQDEVFA